jgi:hypothetical protein
MNRMAAIQDSGMNQLAIAKGKLIVSMQYCFLCVITILNDSPPVDHETSAPFYRLNITCSEL